MEKIDFDSYLIRWFGFKSFAEYEQFFAHFLLHLSLGLILLSIKWWLGFGSLAFALYKELINDKEYKKLFQGSEEKRSMKLDFISRGVGSILPFMTLLWR